MGVFSLKQKLVDKFIAPQFRGALDMDQIEKALSLSDTADNKGKTLLGISVVSGNGQMSLIDAVYINRNGIFVVKIVNQGALIYGDDTSRNWTSTTISFSAGSTSSCNTDSGNEESKHTTTGNIASNKSGGTAAAARNPLKKLSFENPVLQNDADIFALRKIVGEDVPLFSVVVFPNDADFEDIHMTKIKCCICHLRNFSKQIRRICDVTRKDLDKDRIEELYEKLLPLAANAGSVVSHRE